MKIMTCRAPTVPFLGAKGDFLGGSPFWRQRLQISWQSLYVIIALYDGVLKTDTRS